MVKYLRVIAAALAITTGTAHAQNTYLQLNQEDYHLMDRLETKQGKLSDDLFLSMKPVMRKSAVTFFEQMKQLQEEAKLSRVDGYNIGKAISVSGEWATDENGAIPSRRPWFKTFYKKQPDFIYVHTNNFFLSVNPVLSGQIIYEKDPAGNTATRLANSRGAELRGWICKRVGFYTFFTDNQEEPVSFVENYINKRQAVPGMDYYQTPAVNKYDYLQARGYIDFAAVKDHINVTAGYDKFFWGDGVRSLFLSDFSAPMPFLKLNTKIWKLNYQNLYVELTPQYTRGTDRVLPHKYATLHHLSINATKWLNVGLFESVVFDRVGSYEFSYMIPLILYRQIERANGSPDNAMLGLNFKAIAAKHLQFYGQLLMDEFKYKELSAGNGWWANKFGVQLGGKYFDAFGLKNLDLQAEVNIVRPFTYSHFDTIANYNHYNQPLAHPLGAGFAELIGVIHYQPVKNLYVRIKGTYYQQGSDTAGSNFGVNIFNSYNTRTPVNPADPDHGYQLINGVKTNCMLLNLNLAYELRENLFLEAGATRRTFEYENGYMPTSTSTYFYGGIRLNIMRRDYDFY